MFGKESHKPDGSGPIIKKVRSEGRAALVSFLKSIRRNDKIIDQIDDDTDLVRSGLADSLSVVRIILFLEQKYDVDLSESGVDPAALSTIGGILELIDWDE